MGSGIHIRPAKVIAAAGELEANAQTLDVGVAVHTATSGMHSLPGSRATAVWTNTAAQIEDGVARFRTASSEIAAALRHSAAIYEQTEREVTTGFDGIQV